MDGLLMKGMYYASRINTECLEDEHQSQTILLLYSPSLNMKAVEKNSSSTTCHQFEATLGIPHSSHSQEPHQGMEAIHEHSAKN